MKYRNVFENVDPNDIESLDTTSRTSIIDFMRMFAEDSSFTPPMSNMVFDTDIMDSISVDDDVPGLEYDFEEVFDDDKKRAREESN